MSTGAKIHDRRMQRAGSRDPREPVRSAVERMEEQLALEDCSPALRDAWADVVAKLGLEPRPKLRTCPRCGNVGRRDALRCGYCWMVLAPLADDLHDDAT